MHAEVVAKPILYVWTEIDVCFFFFLSGGKEKKVYVQTEYVFYRKRQWQEKCVYVDGTKFSA